MSRSRSHVAWTLLFLLATATAFAPGAWGAPLQEPRGAGTHNVFARLWETLTAIWAAEGCMMDPHGNCGLTQAPTADAGCAMDPHGGCAAGQAEITSPPPSTDAGCKIDPHGGCEPGS